MYFSAGCVGRASGPGQGQYLVLRCICTLPWQTHHQPLPHYLTNRKMLTNQGESPLEHCIKPSSKHLSLRRHQHSLYITSDLIDAAMLISTLWGVTSSVMSLFYAGMQVMVPCLPPAPLSTAVIYTDEVRGLKICYSYSEHIVFIIHCTFSDYLNIKCLLIYMIK